MSLLSSDTRIALLPGRAALRRAGGATSVAAAGQGLEGALAALERLATQAGLRGRASVVLSHHFVSLFLVEPPPAWLKRDEMRMWLGERLSTSLGGQDGWQLVWGDVPPGRPVPVCALAGPHLSALQATLERLGLRPSTIRPWLDAAWAARLGQLRRATGWYALVEPGCVGLLRLDSGRPVQIRQRYYSEEPAQALGALLRREALLSGCEAGGDLWLERAGVGGDWQQLGSAWRVRELAAAADPAMALVS